MSQLQLFEDLKNVIHTGVHQCNNHLAGIVILCELMHMQDSIENTEKKIEKIRTRSASIEKVLKSIYYFSQINAKVQLNTIAASKLFHEILKDFDLELKNKNIKLTFQNEKTDMQITSRIEYFKRTIKNLIQNSIEAVPENSNATIELKLELKNEDFSFEIKDSGKSLQAEIVENLFKPFFSTKPGQMGQGLTEAECFIKTIGGQINFERRLDRNCFTVLIPNNEFFYAKQV